MPHEILQLDGDPNIVVRIIPDFFESSKVQKPILLDCNLDSRQDCHQKPQDGHQKPQAQDCYQKQ